MNVLEHAIVYRWRMTAYECWVNNGGDAEATAEAFKQLKPPHMRAIPWQLIVTLVLELLKLWARQAPQAVITDEEAELLGLESE